MAEAQLSEPINDYLLDMADKMLAKAKAIEDFLAKYPDHQAPLLPSSVTKLMETQGKVGTFSTSSNPFRPTHKELQENPSWVYPVGPNGMRGYPTKPGEKVDSGYLILAPTPIKPNSPPPSKGKRSFEEVEQAMEELRQMKEDSPKPTPNSPLVELLSSQTEEEDALLDHSDHQEKQEEPKKKLVRSHYNLRQKKEN